MHPLSSRKKGAIAQLVEQRTENPCVPGSIPGGTTCKNANNLNNKLLAFFLFLHFVQPVSCISGGIYKITDKNLIPGKVGGEVVPHTLPVFLDITTESAKVREIRQWIFIAGLVHVQWAGAAVELSIKRQ